MTLPHIEWHPFIIHFPIALTLTSGGIYCAFLISRKPNLHTFSLLTLAIGAVLSLVAGISGEKAALNAEPLDPLVQALVDRHELFANLMIWLTILVLIGWVFGLKKFGVDSAFRLVILAGLLAITVLCLITGHLGYELVYLHGVGPVR